ncbi:Na+/H+ antiporter subunit E [Nesterenkonia populi]|uniref:Na+/H+ antiporter subunit E n=1 Tax=Nesterenkonia populi TaxID=1591087 RepID=UPI0011BD46A5|nr:Na+/H+ antiporter subunit E [Nesterenkonia populi]
MTRRAQQLMRLPGLLVWFVGQMFQANWQVAVDILTPGSALTPAIVAYRTRAATPREITALSNLITLTPGTLTIDVDEAPGRGHTLYVLGLYAPEQPEAFRAELQELEDRLLRVTRPGEAKSKEADHR